MKNQALIICVLLLVGCDTQSRHSRISHYDAAIENLSVTAEQLDNVRKEKDFFIEVLEDFEQQKNEYRNLLNPIAIQIQMKRFTEWHNDISQRERKLEVQHALNVLAAHTQVARRKRYSRSLNEMSIYSPKP